MKLSKTIGQNISHIAIVLFIILFVYAATSKFFDFENFQIQLGQSPVLTSYADWVSWGIPVIELTIAGGFLIPKYTLLAFYASFSLMIMFTTYIVIILNYSDFIPCSCGGILKNMGWMDHIVFNSFFIAIAVIGIQFNNNSIAHKPSNL